MSHGEGTPEDYLYIDPKEILSQYSVEWVALRKSFSEIKQQLAAVQQELNDLDEQLENGDITQKEHMDLYHEKWLQSTQIVQVKREVESRLYEIQREIREANKALKEQKIEAEKRARVEQEKANAMIEWMSLKQGFELVKGRRREINSEMDKLERQRRSGDISDVEYRKAHLAQISKLAELSIVESDVRGRLGELLEIIKK